MVHLNDISNLLTTVWDGLVVSPLTESNSRAVSKFIGDVFVKEAEPFGVAVGFTGQERYSCIERIVINTIRRQNELDIHPSVVVLKGDEAVAAIIIVPPGTEIDIPTKNLGEHRLFKAMEIADENASTYLKNNGLPYCKDIPELSLGCVAKEYRGPIYDAPTKTNKTLYQRLIEYSEEQVSKNWQCMFSHSNDFSAKRHIQDGWKIIFKIAYRDLPDHLVMDSSINGHLNVCYRQFN